MKKRLWALVLALAALAAGAGQSGDERKLDIMTIEGIPVLFEHGMPYFTNFSQTDHAKLNLAGIWKFQVDPAALGEKQKWFAPDFDDRSWFEHQVPGCWNSQKPEWLWYQGAGWYRLRFKAPAEFRGRFNRLVVDGVSYRGKVFLNGRLVGGHSGGFTQWSLDVSDALNYGAENLIAIRVDNRRTYDTLPPLKYKGGPLGWWFYGGICRKAEIESGPELSAAKLAVDTDDQGRIAVAGVLYNHGTKDESAAVSVALKELTGELKKEIGSEKIPVKGKSAAAFQFSEVVKNIHCWSTAFPENRYLLEIVAAGSEGLERQGLEIGFRKFEFRSQDAYLNGRRIFLRGVNRHEDDPVSGLYQSDERIYEDLALLKGMHVNFMRPAHFPNDPRWLAACDRQGIMLTQEIPVYQVGETLQSAAAASGERLYEDAARQLIEMIERDRNHPSVVMWSVGNENSNWMLPVRTLLKRLYDTAKRFDSRPVTFALITGPPFTPALDFCAGIADVLFVNEYFGWYIGKSGELGPYLDKVHKKWPDKPLVVSEFGAGTVIGIDGKKMYPVGGGVYHDYTEQFQAQFYEAHLRQILDRPFITGTMPWVFADFRDDKRPNSPIKWMNLKGLVNYQREKKQAYYLFEKTYKELEEKYGK